MTGAKFVVIMDGTPLEFGRRQIKDMIDWLGECAWTNVSYEDFCDMPEASIVRGIEKYYGGGVKQFLADGISVETK